MNWALFALTFIFGYITCKSIYFLNAARSSFQLVKVSQLISLAILSKSMENFQYAQTYQVQAMRDHNESPHNVRAHCIRFNEEITHYKEKAINEMIYAHSDFFKLLVEFEDWESAMIYLNTHQDMMIEFLQIKGK